MRLFHGDGSDAADTPFQIPCFRRLGQIATRSMDLVELPGGLAVAIWPERTGYGGRTLLQQITSTTPWSESIRMAIVAPSGRRGSETLTVTAPESTALVGPRTESSGPYAADFAVRAVSEGDRVVVTWRDERADAPGIYACSFHCRAFPADAGASDDAH